MKESSYKSYDDLPLFLNSATVAKVLGVSPSSGYELMHETAWWYPRSSSSSGWRSTREAAHEVQQVQWAW